MRGNAYLNEAGFEFPGGDFAPGTSALVTPDGAPRNSLAAARVWADVGNGAPDGICVDAEGAVWYGDVPNRRCVRVREGGEVLETIDLDVRRFARMLGGPGGSRKHGRSETAEARCAEFLGNSQRALRFAGEAGGQKRRPR